MTQYKFNYNQGATYTKDETTFKVWAPQKEKIDLLIYEDYQHVRRHKHRMKRDGRGFFYLTLKGDLEGKFYNYLVDERYEVTDPYSVAVSINSKRSAIVDMEKTDPEGFREMPVPYNPRNAATLFEMHIKDYSGDVSSGSKHRGKFLGVIDEESSFQEVSTGLRHLKELGISHLHLMPVFDFLTVDEHVENFFDEDNYNWGYDPELYNCIEGSYATNPEIPSNRIYEFKRMIQKLHEEKISVVMDVVYNHTYRSKDSNFHILNPGYYYRMNENNDFFNGSGCGNELDTENEMVESFILDSLKYYMMEYKINGFRFDLMGLMDQRTMERIVRELRKINPEVVIYGEPWTGGESGLSQDKQVLKGSQSGKGFSVFNDEYRDALKGDNDGQGIGYIQGNFSLKNKVETGILGSIHFDEYHTGFAHEAKESINYFNSHDNLIIYDKLKKTMDYSWVDKASRMLGALIYMSFGIPLIHSGNEFMRGKNFEYNSYNLALDINGIDWSKKKKNLEHFEYYRELIEFRKNHPVFQISKSEEIQDKVHFFDKLPDSLIAYSIKDQEGILIIIHNCGTSPYEMREKEIRDHFSFYRLEPLKERKLLFNEEGNCKMNLSESHSLIIKSMTTIVLQT